MEQLKVIDIFNMVGRLQREKKMNWQDIMNLPIYLGNDDELNGIHNGWFCDLIDKNNKGDNSVIELIKENYGTTDIKDKGILIS